MAPLYMLAQRIVKKDFDIDQAKMIPKYSLRDGDRAVELYFGLPSGEARLLSQAKYRELEGLTKLCYISLGHGFVQHTALVGDVGL